MESLFVHSVANLCLTLCNPMDCSLPGSSVLGISQARILEWVVISFSRGSSRPRDHWANREAPFLLMCMLYAKLLQSRLTLCNPTDCSPPGSSVHGISLARILAWVVISFSRGSSQPRNWTHISCIGRQILYHWATWEWLWFSFILVEFIVP